MRPFLIFLTLVYSSQMLYAKMSGEGEAVELKAIKADPQAAIKLALRSKSFSVSTCAFSLYLQAPATLQDPKLIEHVLKMAQKKDLFFHTALVCTGIHANPKAANSPTAKIIEGLVAKGPEGYELAAAILCASAMQDDHQIRKTERLSVYNPGYGPAAKKPRKGGGKGKNKKAVKAKGLPIPEELFSEQKAVSPKRATTAQMAILAAAYWGDKTVAEKVEAVPTKQRGIPGAKLLYAARTGQAVSNEQVQLAFMLKPDPKNTLSELTPALSAFNPILPDAAMACQALGILKDKQYLPLLHKALHHPDLRVQVDAAIALGEIGASESMSPLSKHLMKCAWPVLVYIADGLGRNPDARVIPALIKRLEQETGRFRLDLIYALNSIVGEKKFDNAADWIKWYRKEGRTFEVNPEATATYRKENRLQDLFVKAYTYFYGIHIFSDRFVYVVDTSASMRGDRIYSLRKNLSESIGRIKSGAQYNLVDFGGDVVTFQPGKLIDNTTKGEKRVAAMPLTLGTRSYDAIEQASMIPGADTLIFLSDGAPAWSKMKGWAPIRRVLGALNRYRPLSISCIDFDPSAGNQANMRWLSAENMGWHDSVNVESAPEGAAGKKKKK